MTPDKIRVVYTPEDTNTEGLATVSKWVDPWIAARWTERQLRQIAEDHAPDGYVFDHLDRPPSVEEDIGREV